MNILNNGFESAKHDTQELFEANQAERSRLLGSVRDLQLATVMNVGHELDHLTRTPGLRRLLKMMRVPANTSMTGKVSRANSR